MSGWSGVEGLLQRLRNGPGHARLQGTKRQKCCDDFGDRLVREDGDVLDDSHVVNVAQLQPPRRQLGHVKRGLDGSHLHPGAPKGALHVDRDGAEGVGQCARWRGRLRPSRALPRRECLGPQIRNQVRQNRAHATGSGVHRWLNLDIVHSLRPPGLRLRHNAVTLLPHRGDHSVHHLLAPDVT